ncbi:MAG TPA: DUF4189 domain-containing protein, partial [Candidatus Rubrimentiphilum sp.]|nr:DUF4189 domain-containing protein [Candidatus Rubrimentiphilum sp.]
MIRHLRFFSGVALSAALALGSVVPALADNPYGDIAVSPSTGQTARSWDWGTQSAADAKAISLCNALTNGVNDCISQLEVHSHVCGAIAFDSALNQWRGGRGNTVAEADSNALAALSISNGTVARHVCNTVSSSNGNGSNSTGSNNRYGAIAVSPNTLGSYGSWDFSSQSAADNNAIAGCNGRSNGANDCLRVVMIHNQTCGALAEDNSQNTWKDGHGNTHAAANSDALSRLGSGNGTVVRSICNDNTANNSTNSSGSSNVAGGII